MNNLNAKQMKSLIDSKLSHHYGLKPEDADNEHIYKAIVLVVRDILFEARKDFVAKCEKNHGKRVYYLCMEFLMGRSLRNNLYNLNLEKVVSQCLADYDTTLEKIYDQEPDAGLGNGGLGRLAACFLDGLANDGYCGMGYSLRYEFGIFNQKIIDGWQTELPEFWLPGGEVWMIPHREDAVDIRFNGRVEESWNNGYHHAEHKDYNIIKAVPYDMMCAGKDGAGVSTLRLWAAECPHFDMKLFNEGDYMRAMEQNAMAEMLTKVLYPGDNHIEGKSLRLSQQYFLVSASVQDIVKRHLRRHGGSMENFAEFNAIHINDTHPTLAIPEFMRLLMDECGFDWDKAWDMTTKVMAYTNHTVMAEALECWDENLFKSKLPRIYQIICEINRRFCAEMDQKTGYDYNKVARMSIIRDGWVKMANLCVAACHHVNGVSALHSQIIKDSVFKDFYSVMPEKFTNVTNGIAHRRWLNQHRNKIEMSNYILKNNGISVDPDSIFDVQVKRLHEYKRQHLNALHILAQYQWLLENPNAPFTPKTYIFGAKAAPGYFLAKQIIQFICTLADLINSDKRVDGKLKVVYLENYRVTVAEKLIPSAEISEQISLAGTEASGTSNMKFMMNGAITLGTEDGANVEIHQAVGDDNIIIFGMSTPEAEKHKNIYVPRNCYNNNQELHKAIDFMSAGFGGKQFHDVVSSLLDVDRYMVLADFNDYCRAQNDSSALYLDKYRWNSMSLVNIAQSGIFAADRAIEDYAKNIWGLKK